MRKRFRLCNVAFCLGLLGTIPAIAQTSTHEEEIVRNTYARIALLSSLDPVSEGATQQWAGQKVDITVLNDKILAATPIFTLTDFRVGPLSEIQDTKWGDLVSQSAPQGRILAGGLHKYTHSENNDPSTEWEVAVLRWNEAPKWSEAASKMASAVTVSEIIRQFGHESWDSDTTAAPVTYTRYAEFTIDATLDGKSSGPHKALFLFGADAKGKPVVVPSDMITATQMIWSILRNPTDPQGLLLSIVREQPVMRDWLSSNIMPAGSCSVTSTHDYCCSKGRCGISPVDFNRDMAISVSGAVAQ
jgi:hypothetical protein